MNKLDFIEEQLKKYLNTISPGYIPSIEIIAEDLSMNVLTIKSALIRLIEKGGIGKT